MEEGGEEDIVEEAEAEAEAMVVEEGAAGEASSAIGVRFL